MFFYVADWTTWAPTLIAAAALLIIAIGVLISRSLAALQDGANLESHAMRRKLSELRMGGHKDGEVNKVSDFPDGWWTSEDHLETERRAIFAKMPIAVAHARMFEDAGSYHVIDHPAGLPLLLVRGKDGILRGFHNVCRHRAYPVMSTRRAGKSPLLTCGYHGWTYDLEGKLRNAPKFEGFDGFQKEDSSLFAVSVQVDPSGVVFVDLSKRAGLEEATGLEPFASGKVTTWELEGSFNWKMAEFADAFELPGHLTGQKEVFKSRQIRRIEHSKPSVLADVFVINQPDVCLIITVVPKTAESCILRCMVYEGQANTSISPEFEVLVKERVVLLESTYRKLKVSDTSAFSTHDRSLLKMWREQSVTEKEAGRKLWPRAIENKSANSKETAAQRLCYELDAKSRGCSVDVEQQIPTALAW